MAYKGNHNYITNLISQHDLFGLHWDVKILLTGGWGGVINDE